MNMDDKKIDELINKALQEEQALNPAHDTMRQLNQIQRD